MNPLILIALGIGALALGSVLGYYARQSIAKKQFGTLEAKIQKKIIETKEKIETITNQAKQKANTIIKTAEREEGERRKQVFKSEQLLLKRENLLDKKLSDFEKNDKELHEKVDKVKNIKESLENMKEDILKNLERVSGLSKDAAKKEIMAEVEKQNEKEILEKILKLEVEGREKYEDKAREITALAIQKCAVPQCQELTTTTVSLPSDDLKGRIIGKEGRNIRTLEKLTGTEIIVDDTPEAVVISGFDPLRRYIAKVALEKLIQDGRIQPARIEEIVAKTEEDIAIQIKKAGERAIYETGIVGLDPKIIQLLGRLKFRTSYGQNVLLHSIEVSFLAEALAHEIGADVEVCKKAGLLHDIGKAIDHQIEGSHVDIGMKILERFGCEKDVIIAMQSHHEEHPVESLEAIIIQTADAISGSRPGARKDTLENYLKRLGELEKIASSFDGIEKVYAIQAGREVRVFVKPEQIDDLGCRKLSKDIAQRIQEELKYPGEIKVNVIRESRVIEYAK